MAIFIRSNWIGRSIGGIVAVIAYIVVIMSARSCLFLNYDKNLYGICTECDWIITLQDRAVITLSAVLLGCILLARHVSRPGIVPPAVHCTVVGRVIVFFCN